MNLFSISAKTKVDPETGEVLTPDQPSYFDHLKKPQLRGVQHLKPNILIAFSLFNALAICFVYFSLKKDMSFMYSQFDSLYQGVEESEMQVTQMNQSLEEMGHKIQEVLADEEEFASKNFWGDPQSAAHLQSIKYIGYYEVNRQRIAYTKSQLGDRFLTINETFNAHWRVQDITNQYISLIGENDKTYTIHKEDY
jgi:hypothetical protein